MPATKLPWPTIITTTGEQCGRLIRTEVRKAFMEEKARREAEARATRRARSRHR